MLYEPTPGLSTGRNRVVCAARGQYIAITDPDIAPEPGWLQTFVDAIEEEKVFAVGGCTTVQYPGGQTVALTKALREYHGAVEQPKNSSQKSLMV
ncbi:glycosyltransferase [Streptomyces prasinus]